MKKNDKENYLLLLVLLKKALLLRNNTNITLDDLVLYLNKIYFIDDKVTKKKLLNFLEEDSNEIVDFL
jgi:hypothetical protein